MLFISFEFLVLLAVVLPAYFLLRHRSRQNLLLLSASYVFYGWWDYRFIALLTASTFLDYVVGRRLESAERRPARIALVVMSCCGNLGMLGFFKYWGLLRSTANGFGHWLGVESLLLPDLQLVLPVGISFYTFQSLGYTIDVYRRRQPACRSLTDFALYVSFFPQLVAGPIERAGRLLPAIQSSRRVGWADLEEGVFLFASGWFRKSLGDVFGAIVDPTFADPSNSSPWVLLWSLYAFSFQIYLDFSGYTDMARGVAKLFGFSLMENFDAPYLSRNIREFWQRWHISLSTWLRDYLYIPLGGNRSGRWLTQRNLMLTMVLGGLWHGAAWNFALWGVLHGTYLVVHRALVRRRASASRSNHLLGAFFGGLLTFHLVLLAWLVFRVRPVGDMGVVAVTLDYLLRMLSLPNEPFAAPPTALWLIGFVLLADVLARRAGSHFFARSWPWPARGAAIVFFMSLGFILGSGENRAFIYFQF